MQQVNPKSMRCASTALFSLILVLSSVAGGINSEVQTLQERDLPQSVGDDNSSSELAFGWATSAGGALDDFISQSATYANGTIIVAGSYGGDIQFRDQIDGHGATAGANDRDAMLGWINPNGTWNASVSFGTSGLDSVEAIALLPSGDVIVAGNFCLNTVRSPCELSLGDLDPLEKEEADDDGNVFLARLTSNGVWSWAKQFGNSNDNFVFDMMVTPNNEIHLGILYRGELDFKGDVLEGGSEMNLMIATFNEAGEALSHVIIRGEEGVESIGGLCQDGAGQTYAVATFSGPLMVGETLLASAGETDLMVASYQANEWMWAVSGGGAFEDRAWDCSGSPNQGLSVVGEFIGNASFGASTTDASNGTDMLLALVSSSGAWTSIAQAGGVGVDRATRVVTSPQGDITITGTTTAGFVLGEDTLEDLDDYNDDTHNDIFLATYLENGTWAWAVSAGGEGNDEPTDLTYALDGSPLLTFMLSETASIGVHTATSYGGYDVGVWLYQTDRDNDGILDGEDNCPRITNTAQGNHDGDLFGDDCDGDDDNDGVTDELDDCPSGAVSWTSDASSDHDSDGCEDAGEDFDDDEDTVFDFNDLCPLGPVGWISTPEEDNEGDGCADFDTDEDGYIDQMDNCPETANSAQGDLDGDGFGDACDVDEDGDGIAAPEDNCPRDITPWTSTPFNDYDQDGCYDDTMDVDDDNDGYQDVNDACPRGEISWNNDADETMDLELNGLDHDQDGCQDAIEDDDDDNDGVLDAIDACPTGLIGVAMVGQDADGDGCIDAAEDDDDDNDGVIDAIDVCPQTPIGDQVGIQGCSITQLDDDLDGVSNADDMCLNSLPGRLVDGSGCAILNQADGSVSNEADQNGLTTWLFVFAGVLLLAAGIVASNGRALPKTEANVTPPKRPVDLEEATDLDAPSNEQE